MKGEAMATDIDRRIADHALRVALEEQIREAWKIRRWFRTTGRTLFGLRWTDLEAMNAADLRRYVRHLRRVRAR